jgi:hypothetical protein
LPENAGNDPPEVGSGPRVEVHDDDEPDERHDVEDEDTD